MDDIDDNSLVENISKKAENPRILYSAEEWAEYRNRPVACLLHERVKPPCKSWLNPARDCG
jgi:hypothetical protein